MAREKALDDAELARLRKEAGTALVALDGFDTLVETFLRANNQRLDHFGLLAVGRPDFVYRMRRGTDFRRSTLRQVVAFMGGSDEKT